VCRYVCICVYISVHVCKIRKCVGVCVCKHRARSQRQPATNAHTREKLTVNIHKKNTRFCNQLAHREKSAATA